MLYIFLLYFLYLFIIYYILYSIYFHYYLYLFYEFNKSYFYSNIIDNTFLIKSKYYINFLIIIYIMF